MPNNSGYDGSITIDTELDKDGFKAGSAELLDAIHSLIREIQKLGAIMQEAFAGASQPLTGADAKMQKLETTVTQLEEKTRDLQQTADDLSDRLAALGAQDDPISSDSFNAAGDAATKAADKIEKLQSQTASLGADLNAVNDAPVSPKLDTKDAQKATQSLNKEIDKVNTTLDKLAKQFEKAEETGDVSVESLRQQYDAAQKQVEALKAAVEQLGNTQFLTADAKSAKKTAAEISGLTNVLKVYQQICAEIGAQIERENSNDPWLYADYKYNRDEVKKVQAQIEQLKASQFISGKDTAEFQDFVDALNAAIDRTNALGEAIDDLEYSTPTLKDLAQSLWDVLLADDTEPRDLLTAYQDWLTDCGRDVDREGASISESVKGTVGDIVFTVGALVSSLSDIWDQVKDGVMSVAQTAASAWQSSATQAGAFKTLMGGVADELKADTSALGGLAQALYGLATENPEAIADGLKTAFSGLGGIISSNVQQFVALSRILANLVGQIAVKPWENFAKVLKNKVGKAVSSLTDKVKDYVSSLKSFGNSSDSAAQLVEKLARSLTSLKRMLITRLKRTFISTIFSEVNSAIQALAQYSSRFNQSMSNITNAATEVSANVAVAFGNLLNAIEPVITTIINLLSTAISYINVFFALLSGKSTVTVAKKQTASYADSLSDAADAASDAADGTQAAGDAAEAASKQLADFDDLNILTDDSSSSSGSDGSSGSGSGSGTGTDADDLFEEVAIDSLLPDEVADFFDALMEAIAAGDWYGVGLVIAEGLNAALQVVDDWINNTLRPEGVKWAERIAEILNGIVDGLDWELLGKTVADGINALADIFNTFLTTFDFEALGKGISRSFNSMFENLEWDLLGETFANRWNALIDTLHGIISGTDWASLGKGLGTGIQAAIDTLDLSTAANALGLALAGLCNTAMNLMGEIDFSSLGVKIGTALNRFLISYDLSSYDIGTALATAFNNAVATISGLLSTGTLNRLATLLAKEINSLISTLDLDSAASTLATALVQMCNAAVNFMSSIDWTSLGKKIASSLKTFLSSGFLGDVGTVFGTTLNSVITAASSFANEFTTSDWQALGKQIATGINNFFKSVDWIKLGLTLHSLAEGLISAAKTAVAEVDWTEIRSDISKALNKLDWSKIKTDFVGVAVDFIGEVFILAMYNLGAQIGQSLLNGILTIPSKMATVGYYIISGLLNGILGAITGIATWVKTNIVDPIVEAVKKFFGINSPSTVFAEIGSYLIEGLIEGIEKIIDKVTKPFQTIWKNITGVFSGTSSWFGGTFGDAFDTAQGAWSGAKKTFTTVKDNVVGGFTNLASNVQSKFTTAYSDAKGAWSSAKSGFTTIKDNVVSGFSTLASNTKSKFSTAYSDAKGAWSSAKSGFTTIKDNVVSGFSNLATNTQSKFSTAYSSSKSAWSSAKSAFTTVCSNVVSGFSKLNTNLKSKFSTAMSTVKNLGWKSTGTSIITGILNGMYNWGSKLKSWANSLLSSAKSALGIHSPSVLFRDAVGVMLGLGVAEGLEDSESTVVETMSSIADAVAAEANAGDYTLGTVLPDSTVSTALGNFSATITDSFSDLLSSLQAIADNVVFTTPSIGAGTVMPYSVAAKVAGYTDGTEITDAIEAANDELSSDMSQAITNAANLIVVAIRALNLNGNIDYNSLTQHTIDEINRRTRMFSTSPLEG